ncbi:MAG: valine--tRNA ligase [Chlorobiaceae bacterium]|nr:valine--tRNA ligase [Chlorobiaceae bacterium]MBA4309279.1 valine--tRNA ligase [Chlorobiaceae bacterium]
MEIAKTYNPTAVEDKWYQNWIENNLFQAEVDSSKKPYTIVIPPPNITGMLTMGHVLNNTIQDVFIRTKRMEGFNACWVPGTDHASIATETKVFNFLKDQGIDKFKIGREEFLKHCQSWKEKYGGIIIQQLKKLGVSCDWSRERFTMDSEYYHEVIKAFVELYNQGNIYRGYRMVNWCPATKSAISDEEVLFRVQSGKLYFFSYPIEGENEFITIATTRPETMLGDTAVAVNPNDDRFKHLVGKNVLLPIADRLIPIIADEYVDSNFGTGAVKITPAHDVNDNVIGLRHNLEFINIFNEDATTNNNVPLEFRGLDRFEVRKKIVARFEEFGLLVKVEDYQNRVGYSERGGVPIEPYLSEQWFMKMDVIVKPAIEVVQNGSVKFHPAHWSKTYFNWLMNIKDWCISRQLWWGHRIPVWYHKETKEIYCDVTPPKDLENWKQEEDVLDTWASSWLWAHGVFKTEEEKKYFYPTDLLVTAPDILFFWVARMIIAGLHFEKEIPFKDVYFTSVIRDMQGRKMSKSLGNSPDPLDVIAEYGADALRFTIIYLAPLGQDVLFSSDKCEIGRNFANKIWNAGRFLLMNAEKINTNDELIDKHRDFIDDWIDSRFNSTMKELNKAMENFELNNCSKIIYSFVWNDFCDWYIELNKNKFYSDNEELKSAALTRTLKMFENLLKIVHPFMPFITEELWNLIESRKSNESISTSFYPKYDEAKINAEAENEMEIFQEITTAIRNIRGEMNIAPSKSIKVFLKSDNLSNKNIDFLKKLTRAEEIVIDGKIQKPKASASAVLKNCEVYVPLEGLIDLEIERARLMKEVARFENGLNGINKKLSNENFVNNAPKDIVEKEMLKQKDCLENLEKIKEILQELS